MASSNEDFKPTVVVDGKEKTFFEILRDLVSKAPVGVQEEFNIIFAKEIQKEDLKKNEIIN